MSLVELTIIATLGVAIAMMTLSLVIRISKQSSALEYRLLLIEQGEYNLDRLMRELDFMTPEKLAGLDYGKESFGGESIKYWSSSRLEETGQIFLEEISLSTDLTRAETGESDSAKIDEATAEAAEGDAPESENVPTGAYVERRYFSPRGDEAVKTDRETFRKFLSQARVDLAFRPTFAEGDASLRPVDIEIVLTIDGDPFQPSDKKAVRPFTLRRTWTPTGGLTP